MDIGKSFTYMFDDKKWVEKLLIGGLLTLIPIVNFFAIGYAIRALVAAKRSESPALPEWDDWGQDWVKGFMVSFLAPLIYSLPIAVLAIPYGIVMWAMTGSSDAGPGLCSAAFSCLSSLWGLAMAVFLPAAMVKYAEDPKLSSFFKFAEIWEFIRENLSNYLIALLLTIAAFLVASIVGGIACGIGIAFTSFWASLVAAYLLGRVKGETGIAEAAVVDEISYGDLSPSDFSEDEETVDFSADDDETSEVE